MSARTLAALSSSVLLLALANPSPLPAQVPDSSRLTLDRNFASKELSPEFFSGARWLDGEAAYTRLERESSTPKARALVRDDAASGPRDVWIPASRCVPPGDSVPLAIEGYVVSVDRKSVLLFTSSRKVWRLNTRGDSWTLDRATWRLRKLGGPDAAPWTLMFAKFSPDGRRVAYVREHNLYVENLADGQIIPLTSDGSPTVINGTFDRVYEKELKPRDGFRWSPDGKRIAFRQLDASGVRDFLLINDTDSLYSFTIPVQYPKAGTTNLAGRVGVVSADGGTPTWLDVPGDPRNNYIARMEWAASSDEIVLEHLNRPQNTLTVMLANAGTGQVQTVLTERDSAWVDVVDDLRWIDGGKNFTWISERDGWRHLYVVSRDGSVVGSNIPLLARLVFRFQESWCIVEQPPAPLQRGRPQMHAWKAHRVLVMLLAIAAGCQPRVNLEQEATEVRGLLERNDQALLKEDVAMMMSVYPEGVPVVVDGAIERWSRAEAERMWRDMFKNVDYPIVEDVGQPVIHVSKDGTTAWAVRQFRTTVAYSDSTGTRQSVEDIGAELMVYEKKDGHWILAAAAESHQPVNAPAAGTQ